MNVRLALISVLLWCAGCTQDPASPVAGSSHAVQGPADLALAGGPASRAAPVRRHTFADLPDHGDLVAYPPQRVVRRDGAYTWHRASLSEDHALQAVGGVMAITTPAGERLQFQYERHVEHPSGDWTWIGRAKGGAAADEVVLTFGEKAAFGSISQPGRAPLKLTMGGGVSWLIETDRSQIADIDNPGTRPRRPDFLVPPKLKAGSGATAELTTPGPSTSSAAAQSTATTVVDVLLGYTNGYAAAQGGQSQAVTRLNNMVEIANQAYANSQVEARIRLVHAMQVSYPDNTANDGTLEAMTGFRAPSTRTTPDPAFAALRSARDQYGADLVSLVRDFQTPENEGCGIAWLLGGGQSGIDSSDEYFGYSVVSDGRDAGTDGKTYFCREETLAHEVGHNTGSQHDRVAATVDGDVKYGIHAYSFGYKPGPEAGNFYTVMAYGDSGQTPFRTFSNPRSTFCGGLACGVDGQADNGRSLTQTMPIVSNFRATVVPMRAAFVRNDYDGDGRSDIYWRNAATGTNDQWIMDGAAIRSVVTVHREVDPNWRVAGSGDFNGDGRADVFWRHALTGQTYVHLMDGSKILASSGYSYAVADQSWTIAAFGDFDADGKTDVYWRSTSTGVNDIWLMDGPNPRSIRSIHREADQAWKVVGAGDFNGDGYDDVFWRHAATGQNYIHLMSGMTVLAGSGYAWTVASSSWQVVAINDFNGDGKADLYWRNSASGRNDLWIMNGVNTADAQYVYTEANNAWKVVNSGDYNGDGKADIFWRNAGTGENYVHLMSGANILSGSSLHTVSDLNWKVTGF